MIHHCDMRMEKGLACGCNPFFIYILFYDGLAREKGLARVFKE